MRKKKNHIPRMKNGVNEQATALDKHLTNRRKMFIKSFTPIENRDYDGHVCWHGCDKVSRIGPNGLSGGGGS